MHMVYAWLIAALFTIATIWKQPKHPLMDEWTNSGIHTKGYFEPLKRMNLTICDSMDRPREHYAKRNASGREKRNTIRSLLY